MICAERKSPAAANHPGFSQANATDCIAQLGRLPAADTKARAILDLLLTGQTLNRFEAERHHDHCLHSTIAELRAGGWVCRSRWECVPAVRGTKTVRIKRYWLESAVVDLWRSRKRCGRMVGAGGG